jgi:hypothetical protein
VGDCLIVLRRDWKSSFVFSFEKRANLKGKAAAETYVPIWRVLISSHFSYMGRI